METLAEPVVFETLADKQFSGGWEHKDIPLTITRDEKGTIFANRKKAKIMYNGFQLRFRISDEIVYFISNNTHHPPLPIAEMFKALCPEKAN